MPRTDYRPQTEMTQGYPAQATKHAVPRLATHQLADPMQGTEDAAVPKRPKKSLKDVRKLLAIGKGADAFSSARKDRVMRRLRMGKGTDDNDPGPDDDEPGSPTADAPPAKQLQQIAGTVKRMMTEPRGLETPLWTEGDFYLFDYIYWTKGLPPFGGQRVWPPRKKPPPGATPALGGAANAALDEEAALKAMQEDIKGQAKEMGTPSSSDAEEAEDPGDGSVRAPRRLKLPPAVPPGEKKEKGVKYIIQRLGMARPSMAFLPLWKASREGESMFKGGTVDIDAAEIAVEAAAEGPSRTPTARSARSRRSGRGSGDYADSDATTGRYGDPSLCVSAPSQSAPPTGRDPPRRSARSRRSGRDADDDAYAVSPHTGPATTPAATPAPPPRGARVSARSVGSAAPPAPAGWGQARSGEISRRSSEMPPPDPGVPTVDGWHADRKGAAPLRFSTSVVAAPADHASRGSHSPARSPEPSELDRLQQRRRERAAAMERLMRKLEGLEEQLEQIENAPPPTEEELDVCGTMEGHVALIVSHLTKILTPDESVIFSEFISKDEDMTCSLDKKEISELLWSIDKDADEEEVEYFVARCMESIEPRDSLGFMDFYQWWTHWMDETGGADGRGAGFKVKMKMKQLGAVALPNNTGAKTGERLREMRELIEQGVAIGGEKNRVTELCCISAAFCVMVNAWKERWPPADMSHSDALQPARLGRPCVEWLEMDMCRSQIVDPVERRLAGFAMIDDPERRAERLKTTRMVDVMEFLNDKENKFHEIFMEVTSMRRDREMEAAQARDRDARDKLAEDDERKWAEADQAMVEIVFNGFNEEYLDNVAVADARMPRNKLSLFASMMNYNLEKGGITYTQMRLTQKNYPPLLDLEQVQEWWHQLKNGLLG